MASNDPCRGTGRTTNIVLATVRLALDNPGVWVACVDHSFGGESTVRTRCEEIFVILHVPCETLGDQIRVIPRAPKKVIQLTARELDQFRNPISVPAAPPSEL